MDLAQEGQGEDETDLADLISREHPSSLLLTERVKKGWQFFFKPLIESQTVFQLWKGRQKDRRSPSLEQSPTMNRWLCRPVMKVFKTK